MGSIPLVSTNQSTKAIVSVLFFYANFLAIFCYNYNAVGGRGILWVLHREHEVVVLS